MKADALVSVSLCETGGSSLRPHARIAESIPLAFAVAFHSRAQASFAYNVQWMERPFHSLFQRISS